MTASPTTPDDAQASVETARGDSSRESEIPFSTRGAPSFYVSLMSRYRRSLAVLMAATAVFAGVSVLRTVLIAIVVDGVGRAGVGGGAPAAGAGVGGGAPAAGAGVGGGAPVAGAGVGGGAPEAGAGAADEKTGRFLRGFETAWEYVMPADWEPPTRALAQPGGFEQFFIFLAVLFVFVGVLSGLTFFVKELVAQQLVVRMLVDTRIALFRQLTRQSVSYFHARRSGDLLSRVTNDVNLVQGSLRSIYETILQQPWTIAAALATACAAQPLLFLFSLPLFAILVYPVIHSGKTVFRHSRRRQEKLGIITEALQQLFGGIRIVKAFGMEDHESETFRDKNEEYERSYMRVRRARITARALQELVFNLILATLLIVGCWLLVAGHVSAGDFVAFCGALVMVYEPVKKFSKSWDQVQESRPAIDRILEVLRARPRVIDRPGAVPFRRRFESLRFEGVGFAYDVGVVPAESDSGGDGDAPAPATGPAAVTGIDLEVHRGEVVALVGTSGSGKSTLVDLVARFHDVREGAIRIDGTDIRDFQHRSYLDAIAIVSQDPFLFNTTIRENIRYGRQGASDAEIEAAARVANAHDFIVAQPDGYDTVIGERGAKLSGGQRQRLTIARAVLKNAPILILDEATSSLDTHAEREVQKGIENLLRERTSFVIAHRLSTITGADRIVVLDGGRVAEVGTHGELLARRGRYFELFTSQSGGAESTSRSGAPVAAGGATARAAPAPAGAGAGAGAGARAGEGPARDANA